MFSWEKKGVPIRIEIGPKDLENEQVVVARRDTSEKQTVEIAELTKFIPELLDLIQANLFQKAKAYRDKKIVEVSNWEEFKQEIENGNFVIANFDDDRETEKAIKDELKVTARCIPFDINQNEIIGNCVYSGKTAKLRALFGRSY